ncbi:MAG: hypothetical protein R2717_00085 [Schumannella sp.]|nr:hypothetical protein [Microbacteriaceae bacterium]
MHDQRRRSCPRWCVADHAAEDEGGLARHRGPTAVVPGIALGSEPPHAAQGVELLVELHAEDGDPVVAVYLGDGEHGLDLTTETAARLVRRLSETLRTAGFPAV